MLQLNVPYNDHLEEVMDMALQSNHDELDISISFWDTPPPTILEHALFLRAKNLFIDLDTVTPGNISLSRLNSLHFGAGHDTYRLIFEDFETFCSLSGVSNGRLIQSVTPIALTELSLSYIELRLSSIATYRPHRFPYLKTLGLEALVVEGPLQEYLLMPKLQCLKLHWIHSIPSDEIRPQGYDELFSHEPMLDSNVLLEGFSTVETLHLSGMSIGDTFASKLYSFPKLQTLNIGCISSTTLIPSIFQTLQEPGSFPSLKRFEFQDVWPTELDISYEVFVEHCSRIRPHVDISRVER
ncbi:hypothetical protein CPB86DRAFT_812073 [Serendipita vermifera]|nr:hypothetical protein CPB86DRAFT_812073 [Serendipita vermifera]